MLDYPKWKYWLIAVLIAIGLFYATPNVFPQDPAVQISANRGSKIDDALKEKVQGVLEQKKLTIKGAPELTEQRMLVRLKSSDDQLQASDALRESLGESYVVALNLASTVPHWLEAVGAKPMPLGLDLRGGVHFLMEVDQRASIEKQVNRYLEDIRNGLREKNVHYKNVGGGIQGMTVELRSDSDRAAAFAAIVKDIPQLDVKDGPVAADSFQLLASIKPAELKSITGGALQQNIATLRNRINALGVAEPVIQQQGEGRIVVQLPGVQDTALAKKILGATATLEYRAVDEKNSTPSGIQDATNGKVPPESRLYKTRDGRQLLLSKKVIVTGDQLVDASSGFDQQSGTPMVSVVLNAAGAKKMQDFTNDNVGNRMAVVFIERTPETKVVDGQEVHTTKVKEEVINAAAVREPFGKRFQTTGLESTQESSELSLLLRAGSLAAPVDIVEERVIGPSLGADNIAKGTKAVILGLAAVVLFVGFYYRVFGLIADLALVLNLILLVAALTIFQATLTMPGIAGIVLTLGMAIDANVLICERIREELHLGSTPLASIKAGYEKAWATILDANVTHLIASLGLMIFGSGPIRGFAITLFIGILTSMFTSVSVTYAVVTLAYGHKRKLQTLPV
jgi:preprotein translocase subunit SecD